MNKFLILFALCLVSCFSPSKNQKPNAAEKTSPFSSFEFRGDKVIVGLRGKEYTLVKMDTIDAKKLVAEFQHTFESDWKKRFSEDFVEYANILGIYPSEKEVFTLLNSKSETIVQQVSFTTKKRSAAQEFYKQKYRRRIDIDLMLTHQQAIEDLVQLENVLLEKYSYYFRNGVEVKGEIEKMKEEIPDQISTFDLALMVNVLINKFGDGHSRVRNVSFKEKGILPFSTVAFKDEIVCLKNDTLLNAHFPYLHSINGIPAADLLSASGDYLVSDASPQFIKRKRASSLSRIDLILRKLGKYDKTLRVRLKNEKGDTTERRTFIVEEDKAAARQRKLEYRNASPFETKQIGDIGYLKISKMAGLKDKTEYLKAIESIKESEKIIIDVRGNGGGLRDITMELAAQFISADQGYVIGNIARFRTNSPTKEKSLADRHLYPSNAEYFTVPAQERITAFSSDFKPSIELIEDLYTPYYYFYIEGKKDALFQNIPTVVLMDARCYSATDIFLSTFKEIENVTLVGTKSGGGSGRTQRYQLNNSAIQVALSTIVSFQPNGDLYDGVGVSPDILVEQEGLSDLLGKTDHQLDFALEYLRKSNIKTATKLIGCWTDSREENVASSGARMYRPCDFMSFPLSRFRFKMDLRADNICSWLYLSPRDAHQMKEGTWTFDENTNTLTILDENSQEVKRFTVLEAGKDLLKFEE